MKIIVCTGDSHTCGQGASSIKTRDIPKDPNRIYRTAGKGISRGGDLEYPSYVNLVRKYIAENTDLNGICKLVVNNKTNTLIGAHIIGSYAGEYIVAVSAMIDLEVDIENIKKLVFPHPTVCEIVREAIFQI